jgi:hypothetical protein
MTEKKRVSKAAPRRATAPAPKKPASSPPPQSADIVRLAEVGQKLALAVDEVRRTKLDREKLLEIASAIATIAKILGVTLGRPPKAD